MSAESVDSDQYVDGSIDTIHIGNDQVTGAKLNPALVAGDIIYADGTDTINRLAKPGTPANEVLTFATSATAPSWVAPAGGGKVLAVVQATKTDTVSTTSTTAVTTGLAVTTGTLASTSSRVLVMVSINIGNDTSEQRTHVTLWDADGQLFLGDSGTGHQVTSWMRSMDPYSMYNFAFNYVDSPSATLAQVYTVKFHITGVQTAWVNRANGEDSNSGRCASSIIAIEIGA